MLFSADYSDIYLVMRTKGRQLALIYFIDYILYLTKDYRYPCYDSQANNTNVLQQ